LRQTDDEAMRGTLRNVIRAVDDSARSAGQLLEHATVVYRTDQRADEPLAFGQLLSGIVDSFQPTAEMRDITLRLERPAETIQLQFDRLLIESAVRNVIDNAIKYSHADGVVDIILRTKDGFAQMMVCDQGRGLAGGTTARLAGRFTRGANVTDVVGSGLGLTIVRDVARANGGSFSISDREGGGACAELLLPLA